MHRALSLAIVGLAAVTAAVPRAAAGTVGVVVTGEPALQPPLVAQLESWLRDHGHRVVPRALDAPSTTRLVDCFTLDDGSCARKVVEGHARADSVVLARASREGAAINLTVHWIVKGRPPVGGRRGCEPCTTDVLRGAADELMASLAASVTVSTGRLKLSSTPQGMIVMLDGVKIGVTPLERDLAAGPHDIVLVDGGARVGERRIEIAAGAVVELTMPVARPQADRLPPPPPPPGPSRVAPVLCWIGGGLALGGSAYLFYLGQKGGPDHPEDPYTYPYATTTGFVVAGAGVVAIGVGVWLWVRGSRESAPVVTMGSGGGYFGWQGRF
jgi:hypothetical protein